LGVVAAVVVLDVLVVELAAFVVVVVAALVVVVELAAFVVVVVVLELLAAKAPPLGDPRPVVSSKPVEAPNAPLLPVVTSWNVP
jgi:hypothetical protein